MALLKLDDVLSADDLAVEVVNVPEWGGDVRLMEMDGVTRVDFEIALQESGVIDNAGNADEKKWRKKFTALVVAFSLVDENGDRLGGADLADKLSRKSAKVLNRLFDVADRLSLISAAATEEKIKN